MAKGKYIWICTDCGEIGDRCSCGGLFGKILSESDLKAARMEVIEECIRKCYAVRYWDREADKGIKLCVDALELFKKETGGEELQ